MTDDAIVKLTDKEEGFCQYLILWGCASTAYRKNFDTSRMKPQTIWANAWALKNKANVALRLQQLRSLREQKTKDAVKRIIDDAGMLIDANPNEIMQHQHNNCRHCWGRGYLWQWHSPEEFGNAVAAATNRNADIEERNSK